MVDNVLGFSVWGSGFCATKLQLFVEKLNVSESLDMPWLIWIGCFAEKISQRVHVPNNKLLGFRVIAIQVHFWGKYMIIRYLDP